MQSDEYMFKTCVFGDGGVGKSTLIHRFTTGLFKEDTKLTIGVSLHLKRIEVDGIKVSLQLWDFGGEDRFKILAPNYFNGASGGIFMYDLTRFSSLKSLYTWMEVLKLDLHNEQSYIPLVLAGGKLDLNENRSINTNYGRDLAEDLNFCGFFECSSKTGENVEDIFEYVAREMVKKAKLNEI